MERYVVITLVLRNYSNSTSIEVQDYFMPTLKATQHNIKSDSRLPQNLFNNCIAMLEYTYISLTNYFSTTSILIT